MLELFKKIFASFTDGPELSDAQLNEGAVLRPALAFENIRGGPNYINFDGLRYDEHGQPRLTLDLQGALTTAEGKLNLQSALDALEQNVEFLCEIVLLKADFEEYRILLASLQSTHPSALSRVQLLVAADV